MFIIGKQFHHILDGKANFLALFGLFFALGPSLNAQCEDHFDWAVWNSFSGNDAEGTITTGGQTFDVTMSANYWFDSTPNIYNYGAFSGFSGPLPPNATVPRTTWAVGQGGVTTMCFSETVTNPALLLSSVGSPGIPVTLEFSLPYIVIFDGGGMTYPNNTTIIGQEGYAILVFPGNFDCVTIFSSTPENYTNITWGLNPPLFDVEIVGDTIACESTTLMASGGVSYTWDGGNNPNSATNTFTESGQYQLTVTDGAGCTVVTSISLEIYPVTDTLLNAIICEGESYYFEGQDLYQSGQYEAFLLSEFGCDSIITLMLEVNPLLETEQFEEICEGEIYFFNNYPYDQPGSYSAYYQDQFGCDSVATLHLTVHNQSQEAFYQEICEGETYLFDGLSLSSSGTYFSYGLTQFGCDSIVTLVLEVHPSSTQVISEQICMGEFIMFNGDSLFDAGIYTANFQNVYGCDSSIILNLQVNPVFNNSIEIEICEGESYIFNDTFLTESGNYIQQLQNQFGCDSVMMLALTVHPQYATDLSIQICQGQSYYFQGDEISDPGIYTSILQSVDGCDSVVQLSLSVVGVIESDLVASICEGESYTFAGIVLTDPGIYKDTMLSTGGCDSIISLELTLKAATDYSYEASICDGDTYLFNGQNLTTPGIYTALLSNSVGCDSTVSFELIVHPNLVTDRTVQICEGEAYLFDGMIISSSGQYAANYQSIDGCDSMDVLTLEVVDRIESPLDVTLCQGEFFSFGGSMLTEAGIYKDTLVSTGGCDSIISLALFVSDTISIATTVTICEGDAYFFNGEWETLPGEYAALYQSVLGCDSIHRLQLKVAPIFQQDETANHCDAFTWVVNNQTYFDSGIYTEAFTSQYGCDSIYRLNLTIEPAFQTSETITASRKYTWPVNNQTYTQSGSYEEIFTTSDGCDSIHLLYLTIEKGGGIFIPSGFSPNNDGINDKFTIYGDESLILIEDMRIYDRWGNFLASFQDLPPNNPQYGWDGKSDGMPLDPGVYIYTAKLQFLDGLKGFYSGDITILK